MHVQSPPECAKILPSSQGILPIARVKALDRIVALIVAATHASITRTMKTQMPRWRARRTSSIRRSSASNLMDGVFTRRREYRSLLFVAISASLIRITRRTRWQSALTFRTSITLLWSSVAVQLTRWTTSLISKSGKASKATLISRASKSRSEAQVPQQKSSAV